VRARCVCSLAPLVRARFALPRRTIISPTLIGNWSLLLEGVRAVLSLKKMLMSISVRKCLPPSFLAHYPRLSLPPYWSLIGSNNYVSTSTSNLLPRPPHRPIHTHVKHQTPPPQPQPQLDNLVTSNLRVRGRRGVTLVAAAAALRSKPLWRCPWVLG